MEQSNFLTFRDFRSLSNFFNVPSSTAATMVPFSTLFLQGNHFHDLAFADDQQFEDICCN